MRKSLVVAVMGALVAGAMVGGTTIALAQADPIKERQENRKQTGAAMRVIKGIIDAKGNAKDAVEQAAKLKTLEAAFVKLFPAGSDKGDTKALPTVWTDWPGFEAASKNADSAFDKLATAAPYLICEPDAISDLVIEADVAEERVAPFRQGGMAIHRAT